MSVSKAVVNLCNAVFREFYCPEFRVPPLLPFVAIENRTLKLVGL